MKKIHVLDTFCIPAAKYAALGSLGELKVYAEASDDAAEILRRIGDAEVILLNKTKLDANIINKLTHTKLIVVAASGYDTVDVEAAAALNITVCNVPAYSTDSVAEHVFALILALSRRMQKCTERVQQGEWLAESLLGVELAGKKLGIIGFGAIGRTVAKIAQGFSMEVIVYARSVAKYQDAYPKIKFLELADLMQQADIVSLHVPHTDQTDKLINAKMLELMRPGSMLINTARGKVIDFEALIIAVESGRIFVGLDVLAEEGISADNPLLKYPKVLITPHVAWYTTEALDRLMQIVYANIVGFYQTGPINVVN